MASTVPQRADDVCRGEKGQGNEQLGFLLSGHSCLPRLPQRACWITCPMTSAACRHRPTLGMAALGGPLDVPGLGLQAVQHRVSWPLRSPSFALWSWGPTFLLSPVGLFKLPPLHPLLQAHPRPDGEVMPTLDMALFDWTDYEDL